MAKDTAEEEIENALLPIIASLPFVERGRTLAPSQYPELVDFITEQIRAARKDENNTAFLRIFKVARTSGLTATSLMKYHDDREKELQLAPKPEKGQS